MILKELLQKIKNDFGVEIMIRQYKIMKARELRRIRREKRERIL
jgi:hypothetical protein